MKIFKKFIGSLGYKLIEKNLIKNDRIISSYDIFNIENFMDALISFNKDIEIIQVGSNDGVSDDFLNDYIKKNNLKSILVEPIKENFNKLKKNYENFENVKFENSAIGKENEKKGIFQVQDKYLDKYGSHVPYISSFSSEHLIKHGVKKRHIIRTEVEVLSPTSLLKKYDVKKFDLLVVDTEGYDNIIVEEFLKLKIQKLFIVFEWIHIKNSEFLNLCNLLKENNYKLIKIGKDLVCIPSNTNFKMVLI